MDRPESLIAHPPAATDTVRDRALGRRVPTALIAVIAGAEACVVFVDAVAGAIAYSIILIAMLTYCSFRATDDETSHGKERRDLNNAIAALSFLPVLRLVSLSVPLRGSSEIAQYGIVGGPLLAGIAWGVWRARLPGIAFRPRAGRLELAIAWSGFPLALVAYLLLRPGSLAEGGRWTQLALAVLAVSLVAVVEELVFRGLIGTAFARIYGPSAPLWSAAVYTISYLGVRPHGMIALAAVVGLLFGWTVGRTGSLLGVAVAHVVLNIGLFVVFPPVPT
jgi:membrane protease YdiL (CAAX protease family)